MKQIFNRYRRVPLIAKFCNNPQPKNHLDQLRIIYLIKIDYSNFSFRIFIFTTSKMRSLQNLRTLAGIFLSIDPIAE